jgi:hypothetical protein
LTPSGERMQMCVLGNWTVAGNRRPSTGEAMRKLAVHILAGMALCISAQTAFADNCYDLWYERNEIYDANGYCFKTALAKREFDNSDCYTDDPEFTRAEQRRIDQIRREEKSRGCKVN